MSDDLYTRPRFHILPSPELEAALEAYRQLERADLTRGKLTLRWSQASASYHLFSGSTRPVGLPGFSGPEEAQGWLDERHPGLKLS